MRLAFCLFRYFPHSGLARDMLRIAREAVRRGHVVRIYTREWQGDRPDDMEVTLVHAAGWSNHARSRAFARSVAVLLEADPHDAVVGFNKMPGLDFYYAADGCFAARARRRHGRWYELTPRYRAMRRLEASVFDPGASTRVMLLSEPARLEYRGFYATGEARMRRLPPGLDRGHLAGALPAERCSDIRRSLGAGGTDILALMVGSGFRTKGVDRALAALAALPPALRDRTRLVVVGRGKSGAYRQHLSSPALAGRVHFTGGRDDVPELLRAADLLVHPAREENTGTVLLEALAAGLPVLTTGNCGYAGHVRDSGAGIVLDPPFDQAALNRAFRNLIARPDRDRLGEKAAAYGRDESLYRMPAAAVDLIEQWPGNNHPPAPAFRGYVHPELADLAERLPRLAEWMALEGETYRETADRRTVRFEHRGKGYFLKCHFGAGWREVIKNLIQGKLPVTGAGNEWLAIHLLAALGIPTPSAVAYGAGPGWVHQRSFIVTRELEGMTSLEDEAAGLAGPGPDNARRRRRLAGEIANTARVMHGSGINHRDFYLCHFLFNPAAATTGGDDPPLHLIDLHRTQVRHRTPSRWRVKDLAGLYYSALPAAPTRNDRLRFIKSYSGRGSLRRALADAAFWRRVERRAMAQQRAERRRGHPDSAAAPRRPLSFEPGPGRGLHGMVDDAHRCPLLEALATRPESVMARGRVLKHDTTTTVVLVGDGVRRWVVKRYNTKNTWHALRRALRRSRARNGWLAAARLAMAGIDTARPVAVMEERRLRWLRGRSYLVSEYIEGETLDARLAGGAEDDLVAGAASIVRRLAAHGIVHGDLKATNFIVNDAGMHLVDLDAVRLASGFLLRSGVDRDRRRFLKNWRDRPELLRAFERRLAGGPAAESRSTGCG